MVGEFLLILGCAEIPFGFSGWHLQQLESNRGWDSFVLPCTELAQAGFFPLRALKGELGNCGSLVMYRNKILLCSKQLFSWS